MAQTFNKEPTVRLSSSGDYGLPGPLTCLLGNVTLRMARFVPSWFLYPLVRSHSSYQVSRNTEVAGFQGFSANKLEAMPLPSNLSGKSVIDVGCSEGFFCCECAKRGASTVLGVDSSLGRLLYGSYVASKEGLNVKYRMDVFPSYRLSGTFDYVICLSLLHHSLTTSDIWKVLVSEECVADLATLRQQLKLLRSLTSHNGTCIVEIPYEYDNPELERQVVDFEVFNSEMKAAGFADSNCVGSWDYNPKHREFKDRIIYVARA
jgi:SAM-dependent methyltransferase